VRTRRTLRAGRRTLIAALLALALAGVGGALAAAPEPVTDATLLQGRALGVGYSVNGPSGPRGTRSCVQLSLFTDDSGATGCVPAGAASGRLPAPGTVCENAGRFLYGVAPAGAAALSAVTASGASVGRARLAALPPAWRAVGRAWVLPLAMRLEPSALRVTDGHGAVLATRHLTPAALRCRVPLVSQTGRPDPATRWSWTLTRTEGPAGTENLCDWFSVAIAHGAAGSGTSAGACQTRAQLLDGGWVPASGSEHGCSPGFALFAGLVSRQVTRLTVTLTDGRSLRARLLTIPAGAHVPLRAFVAATPMAAQAATLVGRTGAGGTLRFTVPRGGRSGACEPGIAFDTVSSSHLSAASVR
jgi:hypothetical protein